MKNATAAARPARAPFVLTPKRQRERVLLAALKAAWSLCPEDARAEATNAHGRRLTYPKNHALHAAQLARLRRLRYAAEADARALLTPNVRLSQPLRVLTPAC